MDTFFILQDCTVIVVCLTEIPNNLTILIFFLISFWRLKPKNLSYFEFKLKYTLFYPQTMYFVVLKSLYSDKKINNNILFKFDRALFVFAPFKVHTNIWKYSTSRFCELF